MVRKKIKLTLPKLVIDILNEDISYFKISKEKLCNLIIQEFGFEKIENLTQRITEQVTEKGVLQFNLTEKNTNMFYKILKFNNETCESIVLRRIFSKYINLHPTLRERILKKDIFMRIEIAIKKKHKLKIYHEENIADILPLAIERDLDSNYNNLRAQKGNEIYLYTVKDIEILNIII